MNCIVGHFGKNITDRFGSGLRQWIPDHVIDHIHKFSVLTVQLGNPDAKTAVPYKDLMGDSNAESSENIRQRVTAARAIQTDRLRHTKIHYNARMSNRHIKQHCRLDDASRTLLESAINKLGLSARAYNRILKIARTVADLAGESDIKVAHVSEAVQYRSLDRGRLHI